MFSTASHQGPNFGHVQIICMLLFFLIQEKAISIWESKDFFIELEPLPGGVEAVKEMAKMDK